MMEMQVIRVLICSTNTEGRRFGLLVALEFKVAAIRIGHLFALALLVGKQTGKCGVKAEAERLAEAAETNIDADTKDV